MAGELFNLAFVNSAFIPKALEIVSYRGSFSSDPQLMEIHQRIFFKEDFRKEFVKNDP